MILKSKKVNKEGFTTLNFTLIITDDEVKNASFPPEFIEAFLADLKVDEGESIKNISLEELFAIVFQKATEEVGDDDEEEYIA